MITPEQRDTVIRTIAGEALGEGPTGWAAVASVINNRTQDPRWPDDPAAVARQPKQFSAWNKGAGGNSLPYTISPEDDRYQRIGRIVDAVFAGKLTDPTQGAVYYYAPKGMNKAAFGTAGVAVPSWLRTASREGAPRTIGNHVFVGKVGGGSSGSGLVRSGARGPEVGNVQSFLTNAGYNPGPVDAAFGPRTEAAVKAYQAANGLVPDGIIGPKTRAVMQTQGYGSPPSISSPPGRLSPEYVKPTPALPVVASAPGRLSPEFARQPGALAAIPATAPQTRVPSGYEILRKLIPEYAGGPRLPPSVKAPPSGGLWGAAGKLFTSIGAAAAPAIERAKVAVSPQSIATRIAAGSTPIVSSRTGVGSMDGQNTNYTRSNLASGGTVMSYTTPSGTTWTTWTDPYGNNYSSPSGSGGSSGGAGSPTVLCTHFYRRGWLPRDLWLTDARFAAATYSAITMRGYHAWAVPAVESMRNGNRMLERILWPVVQCWAHEVACRAGRRRRGSLFGKVVRMTLEPASWCLGLVAVAPDWTRLYRNAVERK